MADIKITDLASATAVDDSDYFVLDTGVDTLKTTGAQIRLATTGDLSALNTTSKASAVAAINEVVSKIGNLSTLETTANTDLVAAINELATVLSQEVLYFTSVAFAATSGTIATISDSRITSDHVVGCIIPANDAAIPAYLTVTTSTGSATISGTCLTATTGAVLLLKKNN